MAAREASEKSIGQQIRFQSAVGIGVLLASKSKARAGR
jgi:hypothetical protein